MRSCQEFQLKQNFIRLQAGNLRLLSYLSPPSTKMTSPTSSLIASAKRGGRCVINYLQCVIPKLISLERQYLTHTTTVYSTFTSTPLRPAPKKRSKGFPKSRSKSQSSCWLQTVSYSHTSLTKCSRTTRSRVKGLSRSTHMRIFCRRCQRPAPLPNSRAGKQLALRSRKFSSTGSTRTRIVISHHSTRSSTRRTRLVRQDRLQRESSIPRGNQHRESISLHLLCFLQSKRNRVST